MLAFCHHARKLPLSAKHPVSRCSFTTRNFSSFFLCLHFSSVPHLQAIRLSYLFGACINNDPAASTKPTKDEDSVEMAPVVSKKRKADGSSESAPAKKTKAAAEFPNLANGSKGVNGKHFQITNSNVGAVKPAAKVATKAAAKPAAKSAVKPVSKPAAKPAAKPVAREVVKQSPQPAVKAATKAPKQAKAAGVTKSGRKSLVKNTIPSQKLDVFVFGEGASGELGLGSVKYDGNKKPIDVKRPRLNHNLDAATVGVVQISAGGMHCAALTHDNQILTWGVNDQGALGRDTTWSAPLRDADADSDSGSDDSDDFDDTAMNPLESTPTAVDAANFPEGTVFVQVVALDSATFMLTHDGLVYGCGTFRGNEGNTMFSENVKIQITPVLIEGLSSIVKIAGGSNHMLALDRKGNVFAWGAGEQSQLGRRIVERHRANGLVPREFGLPRGKITSISTGAYHSFAIDKSGKVWSWGLNNYGETGIPDNAGEDGAIVTVPTVVKSLSDFKIKEITGGGHHSLACTADDQLLVWGRSDGSQCGIKMADFPDDSFIWSQPSRRWGQLNDDQGNLILGANGWPTYGHIGELPPKERRVLIVPAVVPGIKAHGVAAASDTSFCVDIDGHAYAWGFSANFQTGLGVEDDVNVPTILNNSTVKDKKIVGAAAGGQFGLVFAAH